MEVKGILIYQALGLPEESRQIEGAFYFAPESGWDITKSPFSPGFETQEGAAAAATKYADRVELEE